MRVTPNHGQTNSALVQAIRLGGGTPNHAARDASTLPAEGVSVEISDTARAAADAAIAEVEARRGIEFDDRMTALVYRDFAGREAGAAPTAPPSAPIWDAAEDVTVEEVVTEAATDAAEVVEEAAADVVEVSTAEAALETVEDDISEELTDLVVAAAEADAEAEIIEDMTVEADDSDEAAEDAA